MSVLNGSESSFVIPDPREIALPHAEAMSRNAFEHNNQDERILTDLEKTAEALGFLGQRYLVEGTRSFIVPADTDSPQVTYTSFFDSFFEGELVSYSRLSVGRIVRHGTVRALCLTIDKSILLPTFVTVDDADLVHVPAFAISTITRVGR